MSGSGSCFRVSFLFLVWCALYSNTDSETSYTWRLVDLSEAGDAKIVADVGLAAASAGAGGILGNVVVNREDAARQEVMMDILLSTVTNVDGMWKKTTNENHCSLHGISHCQESYAQPTRNNRGILIDDDLDDEVLDCGKPVNFTYYDHLVGIQNRASHLHIPEPEVANLFKKKSKKGADVDIDSIERRLKKSKREKPKSVEIYNQIANFWRIKGDTRASIECFRRALAVSPNNAEILLNLARVLFNLQYLDDAIFLTRRSLEVQPPDQNAWQQHFQLGEILKAYGHFQEAALHLRHVLELRPNHEPALEILKEMEATPDSTVHVYTLLIIVFLVLAVLGWILSTLDASLAEGGTEHQHGGGGGGRNINFKISRNGLKHRKTNM